MANAEKNFYCECGTEELKVKFDDEFDSVNICMWTRGKTGPGKFTLKDKIRWCWHIITHGEIWDDEISLSFKTARELSNFLYQNLRCSKR